MVEDTLGFQVIGRHGELGLVVGVTRSDAGERVTAIVVRGGISSSLTYYVPAVHVRRVSAEAASVFVDLDLTDFVPVLKEDGTIELHAPVAS